MNARLQQRAAPSRVSGAQAKARPDTSSAFDHIRQTMDGYLAKAADARKRLLEGPYDPKLLHAWRVNLRRVTATLKDVATLSDDDLRDLLSYLRSCREATGQCRDIDILAQETLPGFAENDSGKKAGIDGSHKDLAKERQQAHRDAVAALKKHSLTIPRQAWRHWAESLDPPTNRTVRKMAAAAIAQNYNRLKKRASKLDGGQKRLHRLRSAAKKLRYSIELYQPAFPKAATDAWLKQLADLQTHLGLAHDRMTGRKLMVSLLPSQDDANPIKPFRRWAKRTAYEASKKATQSLAKLDQLTLYWHDHAH
ncbi:CHAD domain-containing protein [Dyella sp. 20L07]|uniref:CHAD domain-containing protein n=1 Tax=Dyella sp. 20L07 TaxID=3384240 RepID=UPI003D2E493D